MISETELVERLSAVFDAAWEEWLKTQPHFAGKGQEFTETLKAMNRRWFLHGAMAGAAAGVAILSEPEDWARA